MTKWDDETNSDQEHKKDKNDPKKETNHESCDYMEELFLWSLLCNPKRPENDISLCLRLWTLTKVTLSDSKLLLIAPLILNRLIIKN